VALTPCTIHSNLNNRKADIESVTLVQLASDRSDRSIHLGSSLEEAAHGKRHKDTDNFLCHVGDVTG
jgi:hypothetical protein